MKRFTNVKSGGVILTLLLLALVSGSVWGQEVLKSGDFRKLSAYSYTADKEVVVMIPGWLVLPNIMRVFFIWDVIVKTLQKGF